MHRRKPLPFLALSTITLALSAALAPPPAAAQEDGRLAACLALAETAPDAAVEQARLWVERGGGGEARLCRAMGLFHRGAFTDAATGLEALVPELAAEDDAAAASLLGRAGWAWLRAGDAARAEEAYGRALQRTPGDADLLIDRAFARAEGERFWDAIDDLDAAIALAPERADAWLYRAAAHRALSNYALALDDVARALELRPADPDTVLLRGNLKALSGDLASARADWQLVVSTAGGDGGGDGGGDSAAAAAAANLDRTAAAPSAGPAAAPGAAAAPGVVPAGNGPVR